MPELPEVETVCVGLDSSLRNDIITAIEARRPDLRIPIPHALQDTLLHNRISKVIRRAKYICVYTREENVLILHLGMSGRIIIHPSAKANYEKHDHLVLSFASNKQLIFNDARRFGLVALTTANAIDQHPLFQSLGAEPLTDDFHGDYLKAQLKGKKTPIKTAIMDNHIVVGVGNIYACESLFLAGIHPSTEAGLLTEAQCVKLVASIKKVLGAAIASGGSTFRDYVRSSGDIGYFQHHFQVYGREGKACFSCNAPIARVKHAGRSIFFCATCQK